MQTDSDETPNEAALLAEAALAVDWLRPEEDAAWSYLQSDARQDCAG